MFKCTQPDFVGTLFSRNNDVEQRLPEIIYRNLDKPFGCLKAAVPPLEASEYEAYQRAVNRAKGAPEVAQRQQEALEDRAAAGAFKDEQFWRCFYGQDVIGIGRWFSKYADFMGIDPALLSSVAGVSREHLYDQGRLECGRPGEASRVEKAIFAECRCKAAP